MRDSITIILLLTVMLVAACTQQHPAPIDHLHMRVAPAHNTDRQLRRPASEIKSPLKGRQVVSQLAEWQWPTRGKVVKVFSLKKGQVSKGISIAGRLGQPILAATSGKVVFSGDGGVGVGKMIIIQHGRNILTVYAHNQKLLVAKGQNVRKGQQIATMGQTGAKRVQLHFEIRVKGRAVNPMRYLS